MSGGFNGNDIGRNQDPNILNKRFFRVSGAVATWRNIDDDIEIDGVSEFSDRFSVLDQSFEESLGFFPIIGSIDGIVGTSGDTFTAPDTLLFVDG